MPQHNLIRQPDRKMVIREFRIGDESALYAVFYSAVHRLSANDYTSAQLEAWAPSTPDMDRWINRVRETRPFVVEDDGAIVASVDLQDVRATETG